MDARTKKLVYQNLANGCAPAQVSAALGLSPNEVHLAFKEVGRLLAGFQVERAMPFAPCQSIAAARQNRVRLLAVLEEVSLDDLEKWRRVKAFQTVQQ